MDDRYHDRGSLRFHRGQDHALALPSHSSRQHNAFDTRSAKHIEPVRQERAHAVQQYREHAQSYSPHQQQHKQHDVEWAYASGPSRSPPATLDVPPPTDRRMSQQLSYRAPRAETSTSSSASLANRSDWLLLPSVSQALSMYGDTRRQEPRFSLVIRQQPRRGLAIGNSQMSLRTARSVPLDPPPVCELLIDRSGDEQLLSLPEVFIRAQLVRGDAPSEECLPDARRIEPLVGDTLQSPFNSRIDTREDQSFFVFKELGVRNRGVYRLRFDLFDRVGLRIFKIASVYSDAFEVQERRKHPGLSASSALMDALVDRGMKYKLRKANDKQNPKKRKSPEDFYYGDERSVSAARRQSYAAGEFDSRPPVYASASPSQSQYGDYSQAQLVRPIAHRAHLGERGAVLAAEDRREYVGGMLPPLASHSGLRLSPTFRSVEKVVPQLPSLSRPGAAGSSQPPSRSYPVPHLHLSSSHLPPHPQLHLPSRSTWNQDEESHRYPHGHGQIHASTEGSTLSPGTRDDRSRPNLEFRSSSSSVVSSASAGREGFASTPTSSAGEGTIIERPLSSSAAAGPGKYIKSEADYIAAPPSAGHRGSISRIHTVESARMTANASPSSSSSSSSSSSHNANRPTLPPISSLYTPQ